MRLSADVRSPYYDPRRAERATVTLDGREMCDVVTASEEDGYVLYQTPEDAHGHPVIPGDSRAVEEVYYCVVWEWLVKVRGAVRIALC